MGCPKSNNCHSLEKGNFLIGYLTINNKIPNQVGDDKIEL